MPISVVHKKNGETGHSSPVFRSSVMRPLAVETIIKFRSEKVGGATDVDVEGHAVLAFSFSLSTCCTMRAKR